MLIEMDHLQPIAFITVDNQATNGVAGTISKQRQSRGININHH